jgi:hypothetical protein
MTDNDECPRDDGGFDPRSGADLVDFPIVRAKRKPIDPSVPGTNLREIGTAESFEGIGINMLCAGILFLLERFGPERTQELMAHSYAETRRRHMTKAAN